MVSESGRVEGSTEHSLKLAASIVRNRYHVLAVASVARDIVHYDARDVRSGRPIRLEVIRDEFAGDREFVAAVRERAGTLAKLTHVSRSLAQVYDCDTHDAGDLFVALERIDGRPLREMLDGGMVDASTALRIANQVGEAIETLHTNKLVHGELSAASVVMVKSGDGIEEAKLVGVELTAAHRTAIGLWLRAGSVAGLAPEQQYGETTEASDIYALGKLLQQMVAARSKTDATDSASRPVPVPLVVQTIITKALHWRQQDRYPNIRAMLDDIRSAHTALWVHSPVRPATVQTSFVRRWSSSISSLSPIGIRGGLACGAIIAAIVASLALSGRIVSQLRVPLPVAPLIAVPESLPSTTPAADVGGDHRIPSGPRAADAPVPTFVEAPTRSSDRSMPKAVVDSPAFVPRSKPASLPQPATAAPAFRDRGDHAVKIQPPTERSRTVREPAGAFDSNTRTVAQPPARNDRATQRPNFDHDAGDGSAVIDWLLNRRR